MAKPGCRQEKLCISLGGYWKVIYSLWDSCWINLRTNVVAANSCKKHFQKKQPFSEAHFSFHLQRPRHVLAPLLKCLMSLQIIYLLCAYSQFRLVFFTQCFRRLPFAVFQDSTLYALVYLQLLYFLTVEITKFFFLLTFEDLHKLLTYLPVFSVLKSSKNKCLMHFS